MANELKPVNCGCGGEAEVLKFNNDSWIVMCNKCRISSENYTSKDKAITAWNQAMGERKTGKWVVYECPDGKKSYYIECNQCGKPAIWTNGISYKFPNFCPNCGAEMRGEE